MTLEFRDNLQQAWDERCRAKGYIPRGGMETRYTDSSDAYQLVAGYGRVQFDTQLGWIVVLSVQGWEEHPYQYVKCDETKWSELELIMDGIT
jgi:hypothetical protein